MNLDPPLVVVKPRPPGAKGRERFFLYRGSLASLQEVKRRELPAYVALGQDWGMELVRLPLRHGCLLEFRRVFGGVLRWVVYAKDGRLYLDTGPEVFGIGPSQVMLQVSRLPGAVRVRMSRGSSRRQESFWVRRPLRRVLLGERADAADGWDALYALFKDLETEDGRARWTERWSTGIEQPETYVGPADNGGPAPQASHGGAARPA